MIKTLNFKIFPDPGLWTTSLLYSALKFWENNDSKFLQLQVFWYSQTTNIFFILNFSEKIQGEAESQAKTESG